MTTFYSITSRSLALLMITATSILYTACSKNAVKENTTSPIEVLSSNSQADAIPAGYVIDQSNTVLIQRFSRNFDPGPLGQEFTPTFHALDAVELQYDDASCSSAGSNGGDFKVLLREGSINGPIIGTSNTIHFVNCFLGVTRFDFPAFIPVVPGNIYVIQPIYVSGHTAAFYYDLTPTYPGGRMIWDGVIHPENDLWFTEGLYTFIARTKEQGMHGGWKKYVRADGTTFKNQGEFMRYIHGHD